VEGRSCGLLNSVIAMKSWGKWQKPPFRISSIVVTIWIGHVPNASQKHSDPSQLAWCECGGCNLWGVWSLRCMGRDEEVECGLGRQPAGCVLPCLLGLLFYPEDGGDSSTEILFYFHWTISQKIEVFVITTVRSRIQQRQRCSTLRSKFNIWILQWHVMNKHVFE
jgi:hypothetical protein